MGEVAKERLARRITAAFGRFLLRHADAICGLLYLSGVVAVFILPALSKKAHVSENAMMIGSATPSFQQEDAEYAVYCALELQSAKKPQEWVAGQLDALAIGYHYYSVTSLRSSIFSLGARLQRAEEIRQGVDSGPLQDKNNEKGHGLSVVGVVKAPRGDGMEALVLVTPMHWVEDDNEGERENINPVDGAGAKKRKLSRGSAMSTGLALSVLRVLSGANWLARDIVWVLADGRHGAYGCVSQWLREYHHPAEASSSNSNSSSSSSADLTARVCSSQGSSCSPASDPLGFRRSGAILSAVVLEVDDSVQDGPFNMMQVRAEGPNGQMPNLDLVAAAQQLTDYRQGLMTEIQTLEEGVLADVLEQLSGYLGPTLEFVGSVARVFGVNLELGKQNEYHTRAPALFKFMRDQALGLPTGLHGAFRDFQIDAVTLRMMPSQAYTRQSREEHQVASAYRVGSCMESLFRSLNNLLETFHHSSSLYLLASADQFLPISIYIIPFALLLAALPLKAASLCADLEPASGQEGSSRKDATCQQGIAGSSAAATQSQAGMAAFPFPEGPDDIRRERIGAWLSAAFTLGCVYGSTLLLACIPPLMLHAVSTPGPLYQNPKLGASMVSSSFAVTLLVLVLVLWKQRQTIISLDATSQKCESGQTWKPLKALMLLSTAVGLGAVTCINFSLALGAALLLVPLCIGAQPWQLYFGESVVKMKLEKPSMHGVYSPYRVCQNLLQAVVSPPILLSIWFAALGKEGLGLRPLWTWLEYHTWSGGALYLYTFLGLMPPILLSLCIMSL